MASPSLVLSMFQLMASMLFSASLTGQRYVSRSCRCTQSRHAGDFPSTERSLSSWYLLTQSFERLEQWMGFGLLVQTVSMFPACRHLQQQRPPHYGRSDSNTWIMRTYFLWAPLVMAVLCVLVGSVLQFLRKGDAETRNSFIRDGMLGRGVLTSL